MVLRGYIWTSLYVDKYLILDHFICKIQNKTKLQKKKKIFLEMSADVEKTIDVHPVNFSPEVLARISPELFLQR